jgi:hypothetical protein
MVISFVIVLPVQISYPFHNTYKIPFDNALDYADHSRNTLSIMDYELNFEE